MLARRVGFFCPPWHLLPPVDRIMYFLAMMWPADEQMKWAHDMVLTSMREIFACFEGGSSEVKRERRALVAQTDSNIEASGPDDILPEMLPIVTPLSSSKML